MNKTIYIGLGVLALAGAGYLYMKNNPPKTSKNLGNKCPQGYHYVEQQVTCITAPCPPIGGCVSYAH